MGKAAKTTISQQLRQAIASSGLSLCQVARECGVNDAQLSRFMRDERGLTTATVDRLCEYLGLELRESKRKGR